MSPSKKHSKIGSNNKFSFLLFFKKFYLLFIFLESTFYNKDYVQFSEKNRERKDARFSEKNEVIHENSQGKSARKNKR